MCKELGVPIAQEKTEFRSTCLVFWGYLLDTLQFRIPDVKSQQLLELIRIALDRKKLTFLELQYLTGSLQF